MALTRTDVATPKSATSFGTAAYTTASFTPPSNSLLVVAVAMMTNGGSTDPGQPTISDSAGLTWTYQTAAYGTASWSCRVNIFTAPVGTASSMTITLDDNNNESIFNYITGITAFTGYDTGTPIAGIVTSGSTNVGDGAETQTLAATPTTDDVTMCVCYMDCDNATATPSVGSFGTTRYDTGNTSGGALWMATRESSTSTSVSITDVATTAGGIYKVMMVSFIVKASTAATPAPPPEHPTRRAVRGLILR